MSDYMGLAISKTGAVTTIWVAALFGAFASFAPAAAQESTSATYGNWVVRCDSKGQPPKTECVMEQLTRLQNQANPLSRVAIERPAKGQPPQFAVQVPVNVSLQTPVKITHEKEVILEAPFQRCGPGGCMTQIALQDASLKTLRSLTGRGALTFKDATDRDVAIPVAFDGFSAAYDALLKK